MKIIEKNILTVENGMIFQSVNCQKTMGSGLSKSIREKWPIVYKEYIDFSNLFEHDFERLGQHQFVKIDKNIDVVNVFGQLYYGYDGKRYSDYSALNTAFKTIKNIGRSQIFYFPFNFACDRGGANWIVVSKMINYYFPDAVICKIN